jgi:hypothetical protein
MKSHNHDYNADYDVLYDIEIGEVEVMSKYDMVVDGILLRGNDSIINVINLRDNVSNIPITSATISGTLNTAKGVKVCDISIAHVSDGNYQATISHTITATLTAFTYYTLNIAVSIAGNTISEKRYLVCSE